MPRNSPGPGDDWEELGDDDTPDWTWHEVYKQACYTSEVKHAEKSGFWSRNYSELMVKGWWDDDSLTRYRSALSCSSQI